MTKRAKNSNRGSKPGERRGGRQKGTPNKFSNDVKQMILMALSEVGGAEYLVEQARDNPNAFLSLVGKVLPLTVAGDPNSPLTITLTKVVKNA